MKNSKIYLTELLDTFPQLTHRERQLCSYFFNRGVNYVTQEDRQVPALFKPNPFNDNVRQEIIDAN